MRFLFGDCILDPARRELSRGGEATHVEPQVFDLLLHLIRNREQVVSKDDLLAAVWGGRIVSESTLNNRINAARRIIGDSGEHQNFIRTIARRGVRFVGEVQEEPTGEKESDAVVTKTSAAAPTAPNQEVTFCRAADGVRLAVATCGTGFPVIKAANWLNHIEYDWHSPIWAPALKLLASRFRLIRYDERGTGLSDWNVDDISFEAFVHDLETVADALALERFALLGISQGAAVSVAYAARHPDRVSRLVISGGYAEGWRKRANPDEVARREALIALIRPGWGQDNPAFRQVFTSLLMPDATQDQARSFNELERMSTSPDNAVRLMNTFSNIDVAHLLARVATPTLVLHSRNDAPIPFEQGMALARAIPNARFVALESRNHLILSHEPAWRCYMDEICGFLGTGEKIDGTGHTPVGAANFVRAVGVSLAAPAAPSPNAGRQEKQAVPGLVTDAAGARRRHAAERCEFGNKPAVAVLPFNNMSGDAGQEYFSDGITEDIITVLSKHRSLLVVARNSAFAFKGHGGDVRRIGRELGADYIVEGSVRKIGQGVRITAHLIETEGGRLVWAEQYDRDLEEIFELQDEITRTIAARIEPGVGSAERLRAERKHPEALQAWDLFHLGMKHFYKFAAEENWEAQRLFRRASALDPELAQAYAFLSYAILLSMLYFDAEPDSGLLNEAEDLSRKGARLDDQDALIRFIHGRVLLARGAYSDALAELEMALELNPSLPAVYCGLGDTLAYEGRFAEAFSYFERAIKLSPYDPQRWAYYSYGALAQLFAQKFDDALEWAQRATQIPNCHFWPFAHRVAALGHLQRLDELPSAIAELLQRRPGFSRGFARKRLFYVKKPIHSWTPMLRAFARQACRPE